MSECTEEKPKQPVADSSVAGGTDRGVSESVADVPEPAGPSADPYKCIVDFFSAPEKGDEPVGLRDNIVEMFRDAFGELGEKPTNDWNGEEMFRDATADKLTGKAVPQEDWKSLGIGYGNIAGQAFAEVNDIGPQGEPIFRFNENHDDKGQFASDPAGAIGDNVVFHGTSEKFGNYIQKEGLLPLGGGLYGKGTYASDDRAFAMGYAQDSANQAAEDAGIPKSQRSDLRLAVVVAKHDESWEPQLDGKVFVARSAVPPEKIERIEFYRLGDLKEKAQGDYYAWQPVGVKYTRASESLLYAFGGLLLGVEKVRKADDGEADDMANGNIAGQAFAEVNDIGPQGEPIFRMNENHDEKGKFASGGGGSPKDQKVGDKVKDVGVSTSEFTTSKNFLIAAYDKSHNSDFHENTSRYSGASTLKPPPGYVKENMIGFAQAVKQGDGTHAIQNVEVHPDFRRRGVATKMYDAAESKIGGKLVKGAVQSTDATAFWKDRGEHGSKRCAIGPQGEPLFRMNENHDEKGQFASGSSFEDHNAQWHKEREAAFNEKITAGIKAEAEKQGFPPDRVTVITGTQGRPFDVAGHQYMAAGQADLEKGQITIWAEGVRTETMPGVVAHEIEHIRFQGTFNDYNRENEALRQLSITDKEAYERITTRVNGVPVLNGSDEAVERFPVASRLEKYMSTDAKEMYKADGCSNYSTAYWEGWQKGDVTTHLAYHETLAEISRLHQEGGGAGFIDSRWSAMHSLVSVLHQEKYGW